jgi:hypothetical protein
VSRVWQTVRALALIFAPHALERDTPMLRFTPLRWLRDRRHVLNPFWVESLELASPLRAGACYQNLNEVLPQMWTWHTGRDIGGWVDKQGFTIFLVFPYRSAYRPRLSGRFTTSGPVTRIPISLAIDRRLAYIVGIWLTILIPAELLLVAGFFIGQVTPFGGLFIALVLIALLAPIVALGHSTHEPDRTKLLAFLEQTIAAAPISAI